MEYNQLKELLSQHESKNPETHLTACIAFATFAPIVKTKYSWMSRTYIFFSDNTAFQPSKGCGPIYGKCLVGSAPYFRLDQFMKEEHGGEYGWVVEDCGIAGYQLIECSDCDIFPPKLFYTYSGAIEYTLTQLAEKGELDVEELKKDYSARQELCEDGMYGAGKDFAWLAAQRADWRWKIQPVCIYGPLTMVFPNLENNPCFM